LSAVAAIWAVIVEAAVSAAGGVQGTRLPPQWKASESRIETIAQTAPSDFVRRSSHLVGHRRGGAGGVDRALFALVRRLQRESAMDSHARDRGIRVWLYREHARTSHPSLADSDELARGLARGRLLDPGPGGAGERCAG